MKKSSLALLMTLFWTASSNAAATVSTACDSIRITAKTDPYQSGVRSKLVDILTEHGLHEAPPGSGELEIVLASKGPVRVDLPAQRLALRLCIGASIEQTDGSAKEAVAEECDMTDAHDISAAGHFGPTFGDAKATKLANAVWTKVEMVRSSLSSGIVVLGTTGSSVLFDGKEGEKLETAAGGLFVRKCLGVGTKVSIQMRHGQEDVGAAHVLYAAPSPEAVDLRAALPHPKPDPIPDLPDPVPAVPLLIGALIAMVGLTLLASRGRSKEWNSVRIYLVILGLSLCGAVICFAGLRSTGVYKTAGAQLGGAAAGATVFLMAGLIFVRPSRGSDRKETVNLVVTVLDENKQTVRQGEVRLDDGSAHQPINKMGQAHFPKVERDRRTTVTAKVPNYAAVEKVLEKVDGALTLAVAVREDTAAPEEPFTITLQMRTLGGDTVRSGRIRLFLVDSEPEAPVHEDGTATIQKVAPENWGLTVPFVYSDATWTAIKQSVCVNAKLLTLQVREKRRPVSPSPDRKS